MPSNHIAAPYRYIVAASSERWSFTYLHQHIGWQEESLFMFGKRIKSPRLVAFYGVHGVCYGYSGKLYQGQGIPEWLLPLLAKANDIAGQTFNTILCNLYRDGRDYMGWHSDDEPELGPAPKIVMYSAGATREFCLRRKGETKQRFKQLIEDGSWLEMKPEMQVLWQHALPKRLRVTQPRLSLTFRNVIQ
jgi:alkylated DNA repair dioxygenase AlkB